MNTPSNHDIIKSCFDTIEEERRNLAHELHDEIGQSLTAIHTSAELIARQSEGRQSHDVAKGIVDLTKQMFHLLHNMLHRLHPTVLDTLGLVAALTDLTDFSKKYCSLDCELHTDGDLEALEPALKLTIYRMAQEALSNASRHGMASRANIQVSRTANQLNISIENNGKELNESCLHNPGIGILGMQQRIAAFDGKLNIHNISPSGVILHANVPLDKDHYGH